MERLSLLVIVLQPFTSRVVSRRTIELDRSDGGDHEIAEPHSGQLSSSSRSTSNSSTSISVSHAGQQAMNDTASAL